MLILIFSIILIIYLIYNYLKKKTYENWDSLTLYTAVIVEPRKHKALKFVLTNFLENLDNNWNILVYHGTDNKEFLLEIISNLSDNYKNRIKLVNLNVSNLTINDYNKLLYTRDFYEHIPTEIFLVFQTDTIICSKYKDNIYNFIKYDYVGAPLFFYNNLVGNGGLSLRRKTKMLELIDECITTTDYWSLGPEDCFFSVGCKDIPIYKPDYTEAKTFSIESFYNKNSFGIHKAWLYFSPAQYEEFKCDCPDIDIIKDLQ